MSLPQTQPAASLNKKSDYIDAVRGWAIALVITCHVGGRFAEMPYPVKKLTNLGWHGVQMFFLASAVTLMMSWRRQNKPFGIAARSFFIRRFLRIAPMYYFGAALYYVMEPPATGFDVAQLLRTMFFVNSWYPTWIPTTPGWMVVPGGWSIGVEFTFYALFPILVSLVTTLPRAVLFVAGSLVAALVANQLGMAWLSGFSDDARENFLYFWFPDQAPIFALGILLYFILAQLKLTITSKVAAYGLISASGFGCILIAELPNAHHHIDSLIAMPSLVLVSLCFMVFIVTLAKGPETIFLHPWIRKLGVLSFSAYVLHFLFVHFLPVWSGGLIDNTATGYHAIGNFGLLWIATIIGTMASAQIAHLLIEQPGIELARRLTSSRRKPPPIGEPMPATVGAEGQASH